MFERDGQPPEQVPARPQSLRGAGVRNHAPFWSRRVAHAYLLAGPPGAGHQEAAQEAAAALLCLTPRSGQACGDCAACRQVAAGTHPDLLVPDGHGIDAVRRLLALLSLRPHAGGRKVILWQDADRLTVQAANALLKSVEEPPPFAVFLFTTDHLPAVLPTLRSRCQVVPFRPQPREERAKDLADRSGSSLLAAYWALCACGDRPDAARSYLDEPGCAAEAEVLERAAATLERGGPADALAVGRTLAEWGDRAEGAVEVLVWRLRRGEKGQAPGRLLGWTRALAAFRRAWQANANRQLALEVFCWRCWGVAQASAAYPEDRAAAPAHIVSAAERGDLALTGAGHPSGVVPGRVWLQGR
ncbi:hypothetical protein ThesuDRAFT_00430 [Thermaerobacter subterraneus DSM 13965]|uniref:DNA-directed DNA polymerase n=1 Tax=Thermaerobacter subterraneus DSM 13965 TaxID=867903 RepID=K6Q1B0_9FIRM|nr:hypothetical protein ThesuDRAFT_00430 [Thermaerobacter subterraneus DSM 13965]